MQRESSSLYDPLRHDMSKTVLKESARIGVLGAAAAWLLHPFATGRLYGAGDALWYANMLADYVTQLRQGIFPIFVGQTEFAFNGAVYPLRVAPMYQHVAGLLDLLTGHSLGFFALQHLTVIVCGVTGIFACYFTLCRIAPNQRWSAVGFSILYISCPGLLATIYTQDLYMTWMTVPIAPLAAYGIMRTYQWDDIKSQVWLAAPLAALWWAHAPIALWFTFIAAISQVVRLIAVDRAWMPIRRAVFGVVLFCLLAQYPFVSVAEVRSRDQKSAVVPALAHPELITENIRSVFPAVLLPLSEHARGLGDIQLGYSLWLVFFCAAAVSTTRPGKDLLVVVACAAGLLLLLLPLPKLNGFLWTQLPQTIVRITYYWPMQRFYLILAALLTVAGQTAFGYLAQRISFAHVQRSSLLVLSCGWSLWEARQFIRAAADRTASIEVSARSQRPENLFLTNDSYGLFETLPPNFSNGVINPLGQARLRSIDTGEALPQLERHVLESGQLTATIDSNPGILDLAPTFRLEPRKGYALELDFIEAKLSGILQLTGNSLFREYSLPSSGEPLAFGSAPSNTHRIALWTSDSKGDYLHIRYIPSDRRAIGRSLEGFGAYKLLEIDPSQSPVDTVSLTPFEARVRSSLPATLETPRMFVPGYKASIDGKGVEVGRSEAGLASVVVPSGEHIIAMSYVGTTLLRISYWSALSTWSVILLLSSVAWARYFRQSTS